MAEEINILREFRDKYLLTNEVGQKFVAFYNRHSSALAEFIVEREAAKKVVRVALWPLVQIAEFIVGEDEKLEGESISRGAYLYKNTPECPVF
ncbi:hypothetical protein M1N54_02940 [Thermodesulfovibrionales bacterium]|nr:hypothetical protein [Thermodesulfovibrionales bacterium]